MSLVFEFSTVVSLSTPGIRELTTGSRKFLKLSYSNVLVMLETYLRNFLSNTYFYAGLFQNFLFSSFGIRA